MTPSRMVLSVNDPSVGVTFAAVAIYGRTALIFVTVVVANANCMMSIQVLPLSTDVWMNTSHVVPPAPRANAAWATITDAPIGIDISPLGYVPAVVTVKLSDWSPVDRKGFTAIYFDPFRGTLALFFFAAGAPFRWSAGSKSEALITACSPLLITDTCTVWMCPIVISLKEGGDHVETRSPPCCVRA